MVLSTRRATGHLAHPPPTSPDLACPRPFVSRILLSPGWSGALLSALLGAIRPAAQTVDLGPPPGRLIDIGGRSLHLICSGSGSPTVIIEAGASAFAIDFSLVQPEISNQSGVLLSLADAPMSSRPLVVLTRGLDLTDGLTENHAALARLSSNSRHTVVSDAGHEIHLFSPVAVLQAVSDVVAAVRQNSRLPVRP